MEPLNKQAPAGIPFASYVWDHNKVGCLSILLAATVEYIVFKQFYPYPDFFSDSYSYISAVQLHLDVNIWPIGYSKFLQFFPFLTHSGSALIAFQYFTYIFSALYFYLSVTYFYPAGKSTRIILGIFLFFNPMLFFLTNYVTSDMLFLTMSICWLTQLLWVLHRPNIYQVFINALLVFVLFTFRYNAMLYPVIGAAVFILSRQKPWIKLAGIALGPVLVLCFILWSNHSAKELTGTAQFPPILGGWQWANNALYIRPYIEEDTTAFPTVETAELDRLARQVLRENPGLKDDIPNTGNYFIRKPISPLKQYMRIHYGVTHGVESIATWGKVAVVYDRYGKFLVRRHPAAFVRHYMLPNTSNYFIPPIDIFGLYNMGADSLWPTGQHWFHYPSRAVTSVSKTLQGDILFVYPWLFLLFNLYYVVTFFLFVSRGGLRKIAGPDRYMIGMVTAFLLLNFGFSIFANSIVLRYQIFPMLVLLSFAMLITDYLEIFAGRTSLPGNASAPSPYKTVSSF